MLHLCNKISIKIISLIMAQVYLFASLIYPADNLRVPIGVAQQRANEVLGEEEIRLKLAGIIAGIIEQPVEDVLSELKQLTPEALHQAWVRRFNLNSQFFKQGLISKWPKDPKDIKPALDLLVKGYITLQELGSRGELIVEFSNFENGFATELPDSLKGKTVYKNPKKRKAMVPIEWAWVPAIKKWLPVQLDSTIIKTLFDNEGNIIKIGAHVGKKDLKKFYDENKGEYKLCMRIMQDGHFYIGSEVLKPSKRIRGAYKNVEQRDNIVVADIGQNGVPTAFLYMGETASIQLKVIGTKEKDGDVSFIESHIALDARTLRALTDEYGTFWVFHNTSEKRFKIGAKEFSGKLTADIPKWANKHLNIDLDNETYTMRTTHYLQVPGQDTSVASLMIQGVPAYIRRGPQSLGIILKRLESLTQDELRDPIDSFVNDINSEALLNALAYAAMTNQNVIATRLELIRAGRYQKGGWNIGVAGQRIYIPAELIEVEQLRKGVLHAEVIYDPAKVEYDELTSLVTPKPTEVRLGRYTTDNPDELSGCKFETLAAFPVEADVDSPGRFVAYDPKRKTDFIMGLLASEGKREEDVLKAIQEFETRIQSLSPEELVRYIKEGKGVVRFKSSRGAIVELNTGRDITAYSALLSKNIKGICHLKALVNPYNPSEKLLLLYTDKYAMVRFHADEWVYFDRTDYLYISSEKIERPSLRRFRDGLYTSYFDDKNRREDYIFSQNHYKERRLQPTSAIYMVGCDPVTFIPRKKHVRVWSEDIRPRIRRIARPKIAAALWPSALVEVVPGNEEADLNFFRNASGEYNYLLFVPLSDRVLIYTKDGVQGKAWHYGKRLNVYMTNVLAINTFLHSVYWHKGVKWEKREFGEQREETGETAFAHFGIGSKGFQGGAVFQSYRNQNLVLKSSMRRPEGPSWYPSRILQDKDEIDMLKILHINKGKFYAFLEGPGVTEKGQKRLVVFKGRYFYLPFIAELLKDKGLVTASFIERIGRPGLSNWSDLPDSTAQYTIEFLTNPVQIYSYENEALEKWSVVVITALGDYAPRDLRLPRKRLRNGL